MSIATTHVPAHGQIAQANGINVWYETFGDRKAQPLLLVMGGLSQGILWPTGFCHLLAKAGFFVIRFDHRDAGLSTCVDYQKSPYNLLDMALDTIGLVDHLKIEKIHLCGLSMGGAIAQLMAAHFPQNIHTLTLMATSPDFRPMSLAFDDMFPEDIVLSRPTNRYLETMKEFMKTQPITYEQQLQRRMDCWEVLNGLTLPFDTDLYRQIHGEFLERLKHPESLANHLLAIKDSFDMIQAAPRHVKAPTLILHGTDDPIFPSDHGVALAKAITNSRHQPVDGFGHVPNTRLYDLFVESIRQHAMNQI